MKRCSCYTSNLTDAEWAILEPLLPTHAARGRPLIEAAGCKLVFLPAYSPDFSPVEEAFSKLKTLLRRAGARTREALLIALATAISAITAWDATGYYRHCGYNLHPQPK